MRNTVKLLPWLLSIMAGHVYATDGYFAHGYGVKGLGLGGVGIALPQDALAAATNPAGLGIVGDRIDFGLPGLNLTAMSVCPIPPVAPARWMDVTMVTIPSIFLSRSLVITG